MLLTVLLFSCFLLMLCFPDVVFDGASAGLLLWFQTVLPTLFPFFIINALLLKTGAIYQISRCLSPICCPLFRISKWSSYAVLGGFFCGTPIGAKIVVDLVMEKRISKKEGEYLLSFCNNTSPGFVIGFLFEKSLQKPEMAYPSMGILLLSAVLSSMLFRHFYYKNEYSRTETGVCAGAQETFFEELDDSIWESCETILKIGGYIILFCVLLFGLRQLPIHSQIWNYGILSSLEMTNGIQMITAGNLSFELKYILSMALVSFGGICAAFQTKCIIGKVGFSFGRYIKEKLITSAVTSFLSFCYLLALYS